MSFGVEITVEWMKKEHHLLGYFPDSAWDGPALSPAMTSLQQEVAKVCPSRGMASRLMPPWLFARPLTLLFGWALVFPSTRRSRILVKIETKRWCVSSTKCLSRRLAGAYRKCCHPCLDLEAPGPVLSVFCSWIFNGVIFGARPAHFSSACSTPLVYPPLLLASFRFVLRCLRSRRFYFQDAGRQAAFRPIKVDVVAEWSKTHANLMEPTSLGRPHFRSVRNGPNSGAVHSITAFRFINLFLFFSFFIVRLVILLRRSGNPLLLAANIHRAYLIEVVGIRDDLIFGPRSGDGFAVVSTRNQDHTWIHVQ